ncbi:ribosome maturation factor RimP [bacterium]|nr:ribosome maturation factor RimP [bacterium]
MSVYMSVEEKINKVLEEELGNMGFELIKTDSFPRGNRRILQIYIDHPDGNVTISDCVSVSRSLGLILDNLDEVSGPYNLEVSSPGVERPLVKPDHFTRFQGKKAKVQFINEKGNKQSLIGEISKSNESSVVLALEEGNVRIKFDRIIKANLYGQSVNIGKRKKGKKKHNAR